MSEQRITDKSSNAWYYTKEGEGHRLVPHIRGLLTHLVVQLIGNFPRSWYLGPMGVELLRNGEEGVVG
jgi:hypothetical protein